MRPFKRTARTSVKGHWAAVISFLLASFLLVSCETVESLTGDLKLNNIFKEDFSIVPLAETPLEAQAVAAALMMRLHGENDAKIEKEIGVRNSDIFEVPVSGGLKGWSLIGLDFVELTRSKTAGGADTITGVSYFRDNLNRGVMLAFTSDFTVAADGMDLKTGNWELITPANPRTEVFAVPMDKAPKVLANKGNFAATYTAVLENAVILKDPGPAQTAPGDYVVFVFLMDAMAPGDKFSVAASNEKQGLKGYDQATGYLGFDDGWVASILPGEFSFGADQPYWLKAIYAPDGNNAHLIGLYNVGLHGGVKK